MKSLQILIEDELDSELERQAGNEGTSKEDLVRRYVGERLRILPSVSTDSLRLMAGVDDFEPEPVDVVVYR